MIKVLQIIPSLSKGGAERLVLDICNEFSMRNNIEVLLVTLHPDNDYSFLSSGINKRICNASVIPSISRKHAISIKPFIDTVNEFHPDIIHSHLFEAEMLSRWHLFDNIKYISHFHSNVEQFRNLNLGALFNKKRLTHYYEKQILKKQYIKCNNKFIVVSGDSEMYFKNVLPAKITSNIHKIPNAINYSEFFADRSGYRLKDKLRLVSTGSLQPGKNHIFLLQVVSELRKRGYDIVLDIIGEGTERINIEKTISKLDLAEHVKLQGMVDHVKEYYGNADVYVHASHYESFGLSMLEAMAAGLPVICLDGQGNRDIIEEGRNGYMIYQEDVALFADKIVELINHPEEYKRVSFFAQQYARKYDIKDYCDRLMELYISI